MTVYFVRLDKDGPVKIGFSESLPKRLIYLRVGFSAEFEILHTTRGRRVCETAAHVAFETNRIWGEWFEYSPAMLNWQPHRNLLRADAECGRIKKASTPPVGQVIQRVTIDGKRWEIMGAA